MLLPYRNIIADCSEIHTKPYCTPQAERRRHSSPYCCWSLWWISADGPFTESDDKRCCNNTICPPENEHSTARNMSRIIMQHMYCYRIKELCIKLLIWNKLGFSSNKNCSNWSSRWFRFYHLSFVRRRSLLSSEEAGQQTLGKYLKFSPRAFSISFDTGSSLQLCLTIINLCFLGCPAWLILNTTKKYHIRCF